MDGTTSAPVGAAATAATPPSTRPERTAAAAPGTGGGAIQLVALCKNYEEVPAVRGIDLDIPAGEFFSLLGPSGCGKTTTLRMIAGFEKPTSGRILLDGADLAQVAPNRRPVNTVFQSYALFPFQTVQENVAFGLRYTDASKADTKRRVAEALALVRMAEYAGRRPSQLSGGQQQRVALARALVLNPRVLLLDEPLGALDAKLRKTLQVELKALQETVGITFVYVTHDQEEALTMSDRLAVMAGGLVEQVGTPTEVYEQPATAYVADFLGSANVLDVDVIGPKDGLTAFRVGERVLLAAGPEHPAGPAKLVVRPERLRVLAVRSTGSGSGSGTDGDPAQAQDVLSGLVDRVVYRGATADVAVRLPDGSAVVVTLPSDASTGLAHGQPVGVALPPDALRLLPGGGIGPAS
jgi:spermidine/putrescine transport system ATP-binding protein